MKNNKTLFIAIGGFVLVVLAVVVGLFIYNSANKTATNTAYADCMKTANDNIAINKEVSATVDADIKKCTRDYIKAQGYNDDLDCVGTGNTNPICNEEKRDANGVNIGRYNAEVNGNNQCEETRDAKTTALMTEKGFKQGYSLLDCVKYLNK